MCIRDRFINVAYSMGLKDVPLLDVTILASGFLLRVLFGAVLTGTEVSEWLYLTVLSGAFYFSLGKRRNELQKKKDGDTRKVLKYYTRDFLDKNMYMCLALLNTFYALWCKDITNAGMVYAVSQTLLTGIRPKCLSKTAADKYCPYL